MVRVSDKAQRNMPICFPHDVEDREWDRLLGARMTLFVNSPLYRRRIDKARELLGAYNLTVAHVDFMRWMETRGAYEHRERKPADWDERIKTRSLEEKAAMWAW